MKESYLNIMVFNCQPCMRSIGLGQPHVRRP